MIHMDTQTQLRADVIVKVHEGKVSIKNASKLLRKSQRTVERYLQKYRKEGITFVVHKNKGRSPLHKIATELKIKVQELLRNKYFDYNLTHFKEKLEEDEGIFVKRETLRKLAHEIPCVKRAKRRRKGKARKRRERMESCGMMLQMDGSFHKWFGDKKSCLILSIEDANSEIHGEFFKAETTKGYLKVLKEIVDLRGVFKFLYVDKAGLFGGPKRCHFSQVKRACEELGIEIIFANSPEGKGRIERAFNTIQDRLIPELRQEGITSMSEANKFLKEKFIPNVWEKKMMVEPESSVSEYTNVPRDIDLDNVFICKYHRKVKRDHTFSYKNQLYLIEDNIRESIANQKLEICVSKDESMRVFFAGKVLKASKVTVPKREAKDKTKRKSHYKKQIPIAIEEMILDFSLKSPHLGQGKVFGHLKLRNNSICRSTIRSVWDRHGMSTIALRLEKASRNRKVA